MVLSPKVFFKKIVGPLGKEIFRHRTFGNALYVTKPISLPKKRILPKVIGDENKSMLESNPESMNQTLKNNNLKIYEPNFNK